MVLAFHLHWGFKISLRIKFINNSQIKGFFTYNYLLFLLGRAANFRQGKSQSGYAKFWLKLWRNCWRGVCLVSSAASVLKTTNSSRILLCFYEVTVFLTMPAQQSELKLRKHLKYKYYNMEQWRTKGQILCWEVKASKVWEGERGYVAVRFLRLMSRFHSFCALGEQMVLIFCPLLSVQCGMYLYRLIVMEMHRQETSDQLSRVRAFANLSSLFRYEIVFFCMSLCFFMNIPIFNVWFFRKLGSKHWLCPINWGEQN